MTSCDTTVVPLTDPTVSVDRDGHPDAYRRLWTLGGPGRVVVTLDGGDVTYGCRAAREGDEGWVEMIRRDTAGGPAVCDNPACPGGPEAHVAIEYEAGHVTVTTREDTAA